MKNGLKNRKDDHYGWIHLQVCEFKRENVVEIRRKLVVLCTGINGQWRLSLMDPEEASGIGMT